MRYVVIDNTRTGKDAVIASFHLAWYAGAFADHNVNWYVIDRLTGEKVG